MTDGINHSSIYRIPNVVNNETDRVAALRFARDDGHFPRWVYDDRFYIGEQSYNHTIIHPFKNPALK